MTPSAAPRLARFAAAGPLVRSASGRLVTVPARVPVDGALASRSRRDAAQGWSRSSTSTVHNLDHPVTPLSQAA